MTADQAAGRGAPNGPAADGVTAANGPEAASMMTGAPPFADGALVTLANWEDPPFNRWSFQHMRELVPTARISRGDGPVWELPRAERDLSGIRFRFEDRQLTVGELLDFSYADAFLVLHRGQIVAEDYRNQMSPDTTHLLMSVSKSVNAALAGILAGRGLLPVGAMVQEIVPELAQTSFAGATVQDLLDMRAGTMWDEDYANPDADVRTYERVYLMRPDDGEPRPPDALSYFRTLSNDGPHGGPFRYRSILTNVLGWVLERAAGDRLHKLIGSQLWQPMGAEFDAEVTLDARGNALADGGVCATLRDLGRFGMLYLGSGPPGRDPVVPAAWIADTIAGAPDGAAAFLDGDNPPGYPPGAHYRNCWWAREPGLPYIHGSGIYGQNVFVHKPGELVVVKFSTWPDAVNTEFLGMTVNAVSAIAAELSAG